MKPVKPLIIILTLSILSFNPKLVTAGIFVDLYAGGSFSADEDLSILVPGKRTTEGIDFRNSFTIGYRLGYWFKGFSRAGLALEASHFKQDIHTQNIKNGHMRITPISGLLMFRIPLVKGDKYPKGEFLFYGGIGPGIFLSSIKYEIANSSIPGMLGIPGLSGNYSDRSVDIGLDIRAGITKMIRENISLFCEYRYTSVNPDFEEDVWGNKVKIETELKTNHVLIGFSYHYN